MKTRIGKTLLESAGWYYLSIQFGNIHNISSTIDTNNMLWSEAKLRKHAK